jgi:uncharacterized protein (UPF0303 family)
MTLEQDLARIELQEQRLQFDCFDASTAWEIGSRLRALAEARNAPAVIDIQLHDFPLFFAALPGSGPDNIDWLRRKINVVRRFRRSSYGMRLQLEKEGKDIEAETGIETKDYAFHGGGFPIVVKGAGCIGTITVSGLPQREDHGLIIEALAGYLKQPLAELALEG